METTNCIVCNNTNSKPYLSLQDRFTNHSFQLVQCSQCNHIYLNPRPASEELSTYYPPEYEPHQEKNTPSAIWHKKRMLSVQLAYLERYQPQKGLLLDIGCATGDFMLVAQASGWEVEGIELIPEAAKYAREQHNLKVMTGSAESTPLPANTFDAITLWDVFEHLEQPRHVLAQCCQALKPGGWLVLAVPNLTSYDRLLFGKSWLGWEAPRHFNFINQKNLSKLLIQTGFTLKRGKCLVGGKGVFQVSLKTKFHHKPFWPLLEKATPFLSALLWPYRQLSYWRNKGSVITFIAQKQ